MEAYLASLRLLSLPLGSIHVGIVRLFVAGLDRGVIVDREVAANGTQCRLLEELVLLDLIVHARDTHVGPQGHLPKTVSVEIELVREEGVEVFLHSQELLERQSILLLMQGRVAVLDLHPHDLHLEEVVLRVPLVPREERDGVHGILDAVCPEQVLRGLIVDVPVRP